MKRLLSLLICFCFLQIGNCQIKHQFGVGLDAAGLLNRPSSWKGYKYKKKFVYPYPSLHYSYKEKFYISTMFQAYSNRIEDDIKFDYSQPHFDTVLFWRKIINLDLVAGRDVLSFFHQKRSVFARNSSLVIQVGTRIIFKGSYITYAKKSIFPDRHYADVISGYKFGADKILLRFSAHINYSYKIYKGLYANANLNYGYIFERDNPFIGQLGLRYWF